ncbi:MAG: SET domain-containing protein, partial [Nitrospirota bacterium]
NFGLENGLVINPEVGGNDARWINHSCDPNCEAIEEDDRVFIYAIRDIRAGEELLYDYRLEIDEPITGASKKKFACHCGVANCRGTMLGFDEPKKFS